LEQRIKSYHQVEQEIAGWQQAAEQSREENRQTQNAIREKIAHIESLEFNLQEAQQQQAALQSVIDDKQDVLVSLQDAIAREQQKAKELENKLEVSNQLLSKIYGELTKSFNTGWQNGNGTPGILNGANGHLTAAEEYHFEEAHAEAIH
jgi:chromosome segregation ATPase